MPRKKKAAIIAVANQKGGVAKTTTVASLAAAFAEHGKRVLLIDLDPQASLTFSLGIDPDVVELSTHEVVLGQAEIGDALVEAGEGIDLLPASIDLAGAEAQLLTKPGREFVLSSVIDEVRANYDVVLLDCSPSLGVLTLAALTASTGLIIPMQAEMLSHRGVGQLLATVRDVRRLLNKKLEVIGTLPTMSAGRSTHPREVLAAPGERSGLPVLSPPIPRTVRFAEAPPSGARSSTRPARARAPRPTATSRRRSCPASRACARPRSRHAPGLQPALLPRPREPHPTRWPVLSAFVAESRRPQGGALSLGRVPWQPRCCVCRLLRRGVMRRRSVRGPPASGAR
ncbi:ParA family protein [Janibacter melonis]|uniref:ParA family protein n=1 Tax=Janibacter melonis TaxID=262209 RepID=UPI0020940C3A|nr:AAA family ATPase [Janibacter melonis]